MNALRQPDFSTKYYPPQPPQQKVGDLHEATRRPQVGQKKIVKANEFAASNTLPKNLQLLSILQKGSFGLAIASMTASISLYLSAVQIPKLWSQEYQHLEDLQLQERQLIAINEKLKYQIAQEAGNNQELSISQPESAMFISPAKISARRLPETVNNQQETVKLKHSSLGY
ncbi:hypothetical protein IQ255_22910 [Pleurocapsales cyanobacterium LEGE 10410]|nr:hypothetical protein [Pleurocapsales cyanobacterium LEGE 10410]